MFILARGKGGQGFNVAKPQKVWEEEQSEESDNLGLTRPERNQA